MKALVRPRDIVAATRWDRPGDHPAVLQREATFEDEELNAEIGWLSTTPVYPGDWILDIGQASILVRAADFEAKYEIIEEVT